MAIDRILGSGVESTAVLDHPVFEPGRIDSFWISRLNPPGYTAQSAQLRLVGRHAYWYLQEGTQAADEALQAAATTFDSLIYPEVRRLLGSERFPGVDGDPRITIFNGVVPGLEGYVSSNDDYSGTIRPFSNERHVIYVNTQVDAIGSPDYLATLAHELTHLVHANVNPQESTWAKEGLGLLVPSLILGIDLPSSAFAAAPETRLTSWAGDGRDTSTTSAHYESAAWFLRYLVDTVGVDALTCLLQNDRPALDVDAPFDACGRPGATFSDEFQAWTVANVVGSPSAAGSATYASAFPDRPRMQRIDVPGSADDTVGQFATRYYQLPPGRIAIDFSGAPTVRTIDSDDVVSSFWYGGKVDASTSSLSAAFDLSGVSSAALSYRAWFDLESDYDYGYVLASTDGRTWQLLHAPAMIASNPVGNNLGVGYTGRSGALRRTEWIDESIDLSAYAGGRVWLAFWYLTDDAVEAEGVAIRDLRVVMGGSDEDIAPSDPGWVGDGWSVVGSRLPQEWSVQVVDLGNPVASASRVPVDSAGHASWVGGDGQSQMVVAISGLTPVTLESSAFHLTVSRP